MKTIRLLTAIAITTIASVSLASATGVVNSSSTITKSRITEIISEEVTFPNVVAGERLEGEVKVSLSFDDHDQLVINESNSSDFKLKTHVENQLKRLVIMNAKQSVDGVLNYRFVFKNNQ